MTNSMLKNDISEYCPIPLKLCSLEGGEIHHHSFYVTEYVKALFGYKQGSMYPLSCHLTNKRLILEPYQLGKWDSIAVTAFSFAIDTFVDSSIVEDSMKNANDAFKHQKSVQGIYFQFFYKDIVEFEVVKSLGIIKLVKFTLNFPQENSRKQSLFFMPGVNTANPNIDNKIAKSTDEALSRIKRLQYYSDDFVEIGNGLITSHR